MQSLLKRPLVVKLDRRCVVVDIGYASAAIRLGSLAIYRVVCARVRECACVRACCCLPHESYIRYESYGPRGQLLAARGRGFHGGSYR